MKIKCKKKNCPKVGFFGKTCQEEKNEYEQKIMDMKCAHEKIICCNEKCICYWPTAIWCCVWKLKNLYSLLPYFCYWVNANP
jgi:hypothetical protein